MMQATAPAPPPTLPRATKLDRTHAHPRDARITFDEPTHVYTVDGDGGSYQSCTKLVHQYVHDFDADAVITKMMSSPKWFASKYYGMTREAIKELWSDNGSEASTAGTKMHADIQAFYNDVTPIVNTSEEYRFFQRYQARIGSKYEPWRTEWSVFHEEARVSGQIDMVYRNPATGKFIIADWKRAKEIKMAGYKDETMLPPLDNLPDTNYWHYSMQLSVYKYILETKYGMEVEDLFLVVLHPLQDSFIQQHVEYLADEVAAIFTARIDAVTAGTAEGSLARGH